MKKFNLIQLTSFLLVLSMIFTSQLAKAQEDGKKKVHMKTEKIIDGKKIVKDTTFYIDQNDENFSWSNENKEIAGKNTNVYSKVEVEIESDGKTENHKQIVFISSDKNYQTINVSSPNDTLKRKIIILNSAQDEINSTLSELNSEDIETINISKEYSENQKDSVKVVKIITKTINSEIAGNIKKEVEITEENGKKIMKIKTTDANGIVTEEIKELKDEDQKDVIWIENSSNSDKKQLKKEVKIIEKNGKQIIKIKTTDANGIVTEEIKELKDEDQKDVIWIENSSNSDKKQLKKEVEIIEKNGKQIIKIKTTDANGNVTEEIKEIENIGIEHSSEKKNKKDKKRKDKKAKS